jgi:phage repressor protein C with HTH and peptisase S24 domain
MKKRTADYIKEARRSYGISQRELSKRIGGYSIAPVEVGTYLPSDEAAQKIAKLLHLGEDFFRALVEERREQEKRRQVAPVYIIGAIGRAGAKLPLAEMGYPMVSGHEELKLEPYTDDPRTFAFRMADDSMSPVFRSGDLLVVSSSAAYLPGDPVLVQTHDGLCFCRYIDFEADTILLRHNEPKPKPLRLARQDVSLILKIVFRVLR